MKLHITALAAIVTMLALGGIAQADFVRVTPTCPICVDIPSGLGGDFEAQSITIKPARPGIALVTFHGALYCLSNNPNVSNFILYSQIVSGDAPVSSDGPSALDISQTTEKYDGNSRVFTFNLASTRVLKVLAKRERIFRMRLHRFGIPDNASCSVRDGALTIQVVDD